MIIDSYGYVVPRWRNRRHKNWFLAKAEGSNRNLCYKVRLGGIIIPKHLMGKKLRFKVEIVED